MYWSISRQANIVKIVDVTVGYVRKMMAKITWVASRMRACLSPLAPLSDALSLAC